MAPTILQTLSLFSLLYYIALGLSFVEDPVTDSPEPDVYTTRPFVHFFGRDYVPPQQAHSSHQTLVQPVVSSKGPIEQVEAFDTIGSILAQHGLSVKLTHTEIMNPESKNAPEQHAFAAASNHQGGQPSLLNSFAENRTVISTTLYTSYSDDMPWFGDGFCCFEGCPPGSCPSIYASTKTGSLSTVAQADTAACPCRGHGYCCCAGCPKGTCGAGRC